MNSAHMLHSQQLPSSGKRSKPLADGESPEKKPKKVNSEIRKQQNRIASRNYREKRKRKLQYLQQLIKDGPNDQTDPEPSPTLSEAYARSVSTDYEPSGSTSSPYLMPSQPDFAAMGSSGVPSPELMTASSSATYDHHRLATTQAYSTYAPSWNAPVYCPPPQPVHQSTWDASPWMHSVDDFTRVPAQASGYGYAHPATTDFGYTNSSVSQSREHLSNTDMYGTNFSFGSQSQSMGVPNYPYPQFPYRGHTVERSIYI